MFKIILLMAVWAPPTAGQTSIPSTGPGDSTGGGRASSSSSSSRETVNSWPFQPVTGQTVSGSGGCVRVRAGDVAGVAGSFIPASGLAGYRIDLYPHNVSCPAVWSGAQIADPYTTRVIISMTTMVMTSPTTYCGLAEASSRTPPFIPSPRTFNGTHALVRTDGSAIKLGCDANCERCMFKKTTNSSE